MEGQIQGSFLGRVAFIGELYNAKSESFTSRSLFNSNIPSNWIRSQHVQDTKYEYRYTENISERFELMKVDGELQLSVMLKLFSVGGSGSFLTEEAKSDRTVSCSLICNMSTVCEKFIASFAESLPYIDLSALEEPEHTHVVVEILWGANCILSLAATSIEKSSKKEVKGKLEAKLEKLKSALSVRAGGEVAQEASASDSSEDVKIKVCADIIPEGDWPTSIAGFHEFVGKVPELLKKFNDGKGKAMNYVMIPLSGFRRVAQLSRKVEVVVKAIDKSFIVSTIFLLEEIQLLKRKLNDLVADMTDMGKYVKEKDLKSAREHQADLAMKEAQLKMMITEDWAAVKSGEKELGGLIKRVEKFKFHELKLYFYEEYLDSRSAILGKLASVNNYLSKGVVYLGREETFDGVLSKNHSCEFLVLLMPADGEGNDSEVSTSTSLYFLSEASNPRPNTKYVVVDFDYQREQRFMGKDVTAVKCVKLSGCTVQSWDAYGDYVADLASCFVRLRPEYEVEFVRHKPGNRVPLEMSCPKKCSPEPLLWICSGCKANVEYGFDGHFYCYCGRSPVHAFEYRCSSPSHTDGFFTAETSLVDKALSALRPFPELNVLILGQSGVGKSTWINAIINYMYYEKLEEAKQHGVICTIPMSLSITDPKTGENYTIAIGEDDNENTVIGQSATQGAHTYSFLWKNKCVRIIDTPGIADTRGIVQDKKNLMNIFNHIGYLKEIHAVCILIKANENKINPIFSYCVKEVLSHLHRSVTRNVVFCFTNARNTFYRTGAASVILDDLIEKLNDKSLSLGPHNTFILDNEAFIYLCSLNEPAVSYEPMLESSFVHSWDMAFKETLRLFDTINSFEPHEVKETLSLVKARRRILSLTQPIAEISRTIQINVAAIERKKEEIKYSNEALEGLERKLEFTELVLKPVPLDFPRTVCTSPSCIEYFSFSSVDVKDILYKTHCHSHCFLENVENSTVNNAQLRECQSMGAEGTCTVCGCGWEVHMHIRFSQERVERRVVDEKVKREMESKRSELERVEALVRELEKKIEQYKAEQEFIIKASVKFGMFLRKNAITVYNDSVAEYIKLMIDQESKKPYKSEAEKKLVEDLTNMLEHYKAEVDVMMKAIKQGESMNSEVTVQEVVELEKELYKMQLTGEFIRNFSDCERSSEARTAGYMETSVHIAKPRFQGLKERVTNFITKVKSKVI